MQLSTLLSILAAAGSVAAAPAENNLPALEKRYDFWLGCCNPKNNDAWKPVASQNCCQGVVASYNGHVACQMSTGQVAAFDDCCVAKGKELGTPDWDSCTP